MKLKPNTAIKATLAAGLAMGAAQASANQFADVYYYLGVGAGTATLDLTDEGLSNDAGVLQFDEDDTSYKVFGGVMFNDYIGVEVAYLDLGAPDNDVGFDGGEFSQSFEGNIEAETTGWTTQLIGVLPIGTSFDLFAKGGVFMYDVEADLEGTLDDGFGDLELVNEDVGDDGVVSAFGVGARYYFGKFGLRAEFETFDIDIGDLTQWTLGAQYRF